MGTVHSTNGAKPFDLLDPAGSGVASAVPRHAPLAHFHAARLAIGDVVMACTQYTNPYTFAPEQHQLRVFRADAPRRDRLPTMSAGELMQTQGGLAYASLDLRTETLPFPFDVPSDRVARLTEFRLAGSSANERAQHLRNGVADWLLQTIESELVFGTYFAVRGDSRSFWPAERTDAGDWPDRMRSSDYGVWAAEWLDGRDYAIFPDEPGQFFKVFNAPLLELIEAGDVA